MNVDYNKITDVFLLNNRSVTKNNKKFYPALVQYVAKRLAEGNALTDIYPPVSAVLPPLPTFIDVVEANEDYAIKINKAENKRARILKEKFLQAIKKYTEDPDPETKEIIAAMNTSLKLLDKTSSLQDNITIKFYSNTPEDFWD